MMNVPSGFLVVQDSPDGKYVPFLVKVRSDDIVWKNNDVAIEYMIKQLCGNNATLVEVKPNSSYRLSVPVTQEIKIGNDSKMYFKNGNNYNVFSLGSTGSFSTYDVDVNGDGTKEKCYFRHREPGEALTTIKANELSSITTIKDTVNCNEFTWTCTINSDGYTVANAKIPVTENFVYNNQNYFYSDFFYQDATTTIGIYKDNINLPIPLLNDGRFNIQMTKYCNVFEYGNAYINTRSSNTNLKLTHDNKSQSFNVVKDFAIELYDPVYRFHTNFEYTLRNSGTYVEISGYIPTIEI